MNGGQLFELAERDETQAQLGRVLVKREDTLCVDVVSSIAEEPW
jgi:hypothetical protein